MPLVSVMLFVAPRLSHNAIANNDNRVYNPGARLSISPKSVWQPTYSRIASQLKVADAVPLYSLTFAELYTYGGTKTLGRITGATKFANICIGNRLALAFTPASQLRTVVAKNIDAGACAEPAVLRVAQDNKDVIVSPGALAVKAPKVSTTDLTMSEQQTFGSSLAVANNTPLSPIVSTRTAFV